MNTRATYAKLSLQDWESHGRAACYELDLQKKQESQRIFYEFSQSPDLNTLLIILEKGSDTLIFAIFSYLGKYPLQFTKSFQSVTSLISCVNSWQFKAFTFVRNNHQPFQKYVTRTIMATLGIFLKFLYENSATSTQLIEFIRRLQANYFKLYLLKSFVDAVEVVDYDMGYIKYRMMAYSFQDNVIPMICKTLLPYFYSIEQGVQINELSFLQERIILNDDVVTNTSQLSISSEQELQTDLVFMLLQKIVEYNYNITYSEYQSDQPIETCLISFPDKVSQKILNEQFLNALFFIVDKVSDAKIQERKHQYLEISLNCIAKMMQSRLTYLQIDVKQKFIYRSLKGLTHLLIKCREIGSETLLKGIFLCNRKLFMNCQLDYFKQITKKLSDKSSQNLYAIYIKQLTSVIALVVNKSSVKIQNPLLMEAMELSSKLIISYGFKDEENIDEQYLFFMNFVETIVNGYVHNICQPLSIFQSFKIISISEAKVVVNELFQRFRKLASINFGFFFRKLQVKVNEITTSELKSPIIFANILFLLSQIIDHNYLDRNILLNQAKNNDYWILGNVINKIILLIKEYMCIRKQYRCSESLYVDTAIIIFTESISIDFLVGFEYGKTFKIKQKLYEYMIYGEHHNQFQEIVDTKSEDTLLTFFAILTQYVQSPNQHTQSQDLVEYSLNAIEKCISKIKWRLTPQTYQKLLIIQFLVDCFEKLLYFQTTTCDVRSRSAKIIATLTLEVPEQYKIRINKLLEILKNQPIILVHYDLIGIFQGIESHVIVKYLYQKLNKALNLPAIVNNLFQNAKDHNNEKQYKDLCKLIRIMLHNKCFKPNTSAIIYENYKNLLPFVIEILKLINANHDKIDMELWESSLVILLDLFKGFANGSFINIFLLEKYMLQGNNGMHSVKQFVALIIKTLVILCESMKELPEIEQLILSTILEINKNLLDYIFKDQTGELACAYAYLIAKSIEISVVYTKMMLHGNKVLEEKFILSLDCLQLFYTYFNRKRKMTHQVVTLRNLQSHYQLLQNFNKQNIVISKHHQFINSLINFAVSNYKNNLIYLRKIVKMLYELNQPFKHYIMLDLMRLQISKEKASEVESILNGKVEEVFIENLKTWIRELDLCI